MRLDTDNVLAWPGHGALSLWSAALRTRVQDKVSVFQRSAPHTAHDTPQTQEQWLAAIARRAQLSRRTLEGHWDGQHQPRREQLRGWLRGTRHPQGYALATQVWDTDAEVLDWNALLGYTGHETLDLWQNSAEGLEDGQTRIAALCGHYQWWLENLLPPPPSAEYGSREIEAEIRIALVALRGFRQPAWSVVFVAGSTHAERYALMHHLACDEMVTEFFRDGIYWLPAGMPSAQVWHALVEQLGPRVRQGGAAEPRALWHTFATDPERNVLVIVEQPDGKVLGDLFRAAGRQTRFLVELDDGALALARQWFGHDRVRVFHLAGYTANELLQLAERRGLALDTETERALEYVRECLRGEPAALRLVLDVLAREKTLAPAVVVPPLIAAGHLHAPAPAPHADEWIERPEVLAQIRAQLITAQAPLVVLHGPPGSGKSTLVAQLMHDPALQLHFHDGIFRLPHTAGDQDRDTLTDKQIESIAARVRAPLDPTLPREEAVQRALSGRRCLVILEDWQHPASVRWLRQCIAPPTAILVTTRSSSTVVSGLGLSRECIITLPPFSLAETEQFYRRLWAQYGESETDRQRVPELHHLTRGNPLGLYVSLVHVRTRGWENVLERLRAPVLTPPGMVDELFQPLELAYETLPSLTRTLFARLGALPELVWYDEVCFRALWRLDKEVDEHLHRLEHDAGLVQSHLEDGERVWTIHVQVLAYARLHYAQLDERERREAARWYERAVQFPAHQERYQRFLQTSRPPVTALFSPRTFCPPLRRRRLGWRVIGVLMRPWAVTEWERLETHQRMFMSHEYLLGVRLRQTQVRVRGLIPLYVGLGLVVWLALTLSPLSWRAVSVGWGVVWLGVGGGVLGVWVWFFVHRQALWLRLWERVHTRQSQTA